MHNSRVMVELIAATTRHRDSRVQADIDTRLHSKWNRKSPSTGLGSFDLDERHEGHSRLDHLPASIAEPFAATSPRPGCVQADFNHQADLPEAAMVGNKPRNAVT